MYIYIHSPFFLTYIFLANIVTKQKVIAIVKIKTIYLKSIGTKPIIFPNAVKGTIRPININEKDERYTNLFALLCINGIFAVLIICIPNKFETIL